jgi:hypothetical protein
VTTVFVVDFILQHGIGHFEFGSQCQTFNSAFCLETILATSERANPMAKPGEWAECLDAPSR